MKDRSIRDNTCSAATLVIAFMAVELLDETFGKVLDFIED